MAETLIIAEGDKQQKYELLYRQIEAVVSGEKDTIANMANIATMIHSTFGFWWTGFYRVIDNELVIGPFQGPVACTRIGRGKGVCGTSWSEQRTIIVDDVDAFHGHIACSSESRSEIVVPIWRNENIIAVLDIDSSTLATFDSTDQEWLERIARLVGR